MSLNVRLREASRKAQNVTDRISGRKFNRIHAEAGVKPRQYGAWQQLSFDETSLSRSIPSVIHQSFVPPWDKIKQTDARRIDWKMARNLLTQEIVKPCIPGIVKSWGNALFKFKEQICQCVSFLLNVKSHSLCVSSENVRPLIFRPLRKCFCSKLVTPKPGFRKSKSFFHTASLPEAKPKRTVPRIQLTGGRNIKLITRRIVESATSALRFSNTMVTTEKGITIKLNTTGYTKENITVELENGWLVIEALSTASEESGGYLQRHMMRRYELPPHSDIQNIKVELNEQTKELKVTIPAMRPKASLK